MINSMSVSELKEKIDKGEKITLVDCREKNEWEEGHIKEAIFIPLSEFAEKHNQFLKNKDETIIMQCRSGKRSFKACQILLENGHSNLYNLEGGILEWINQNYDITKK